ncbi:MAG: hypothetical protein PHV06_00055 [bacterium]|nr:hypothetical protein [bacterium]
MRFLNLSDLEKIFEVSEGTLEAERNKESLPHLQLKEKEIYFSSFIHHLNSEIINKDDENQLEILSTIGDIFQKRFYFNVFITELFPEKPPIIVGGSALEYYSGVQYPTGDIDIFIEEEAVPELIRHLRKNKFYKRGKYYYSIDKKIPVEIHTGTFNGDKKHLSKIVFGKKEIYLIGIEDLIIDRIDVFDKKEYPEEFDWALRLYRSYLELLDIQYLKKKLTKDGLLPYFEKLNS